MKVYGLTGGIATGKSSVAQILRERGVPVIDADQVTRDLYTPGSDLLAAIADGLGERFIQADGHLDRALLREHISHDEGARQQLNAIAHPAILGEIARRLAALNAAGAHRAVVEAALMVETGSYRHYTALIVVTCIPDLQLRRLLDRDGQDQASARALIASQLPLADKEAVADVIIRNDGSLEELQKRTAKAWVELVAEGEG